MKIGDKATDFTLQNTEGKEVSLSDVTSEGSVVLLFFPLAFSSVCTDEMCTVRDNFKMYKSLDANVIGISVDSFFTLKAFKQMNNIPFPLLSDFNKSVSKEYGVLNNDFYGMVGVAKRAAFVIDKDMKILHQEVMDDAGNMPDFNAIHNALG
jgi:peroxiredoxin